MRYINPPAINRLSNIMIPTLIIIGEMDAPIVFSAANILELNIIHGRKAIISDTSHHLNMEKPEEFNSLVIDFLTENRPE